MIYQGLKIFIRNTYRKPFFSAINILGLAIGIACFVITALYINYHLSFDKFHDKAGQIYTLTTTIDFKDFYVENQETTPAPLAAALLESYPEIVQVTRINNLIEAFVKTEDQQYKENTIRYADSSFFEVFTYEFIEGNAKQALLLSNTVVITQQIAEKYFGEEKAYGKILELYGRKFKITGVIKNPPQYSIVNFNFLFSLHSFKYYYNSSSWDDGRFLTYFVLQDGASPQKLEAKLPDLLKQYLKERDGIAFTRWLEMGNRWEYHVHSINQIYLNIRGNKIYLIGFGLTATFLLLIASINYMNLNTSRANTRAREIGVKKTIGASKTNLTSQFLSESVLMSVIALIIAMGLVEAMLPYFSSFVDAKLNIHYFSNFYTLPLLVGFAILVGVFSGLYPAFVLSSIKPVKVLKGNFNFKGKRVDLRNFLVFLQFAISTALIIMLAFVYAQTKMMLNQNLGFDKENVLVVHNAEEVTEREGLMISGSCNTDLIRAALHEIPEVENISFSGQTLSHNSEAAQTMTFENGKEILMNWFMCDPDYAKTMKIEMETGRFFDRENNSDLRSVVLNQSAVDYLNWNNEVLGKVFNIPPIGELKVIGVIKDFHYQPLQYKIMPVMFLNHEGPAFFGVNYLNIKLLNAPYQETIQKIETVWKNFAPGIPFEYSLLSEQNKTLYLKEEKTKQLLMILTLLVLFITYLGIYGLAVFSTQVKMKEIAIRKIMGSSVQTIIFKMSWGLTKLVIIANLIAWPAAWYFTDQWLSNFAFRVPISWWVFLAAAVISYLLAIITIIFQSYSAANKNPVEVLRYE